MDLALKIFQFGNFGKDLDGFVDMSNNMDHTSFSSNSWKACKYRPAAVLGKLVYQCYGCLLSLTPAKRGDCLKF